MQHAIVELKEKLLRALDKDNNVVDAETVFGVIASLEKSYITRECLEETRIGRYVNEMRKKTKNKDLARRAKGLVRKWQQLVNVQPSTSPAPFNGSKVASKAALPPHVKTSSSMPVSPASRPMTPGSNSSSSPGLQKLAGRPGTPHNQTSRLSPASAHTASSAKIAFKPISPALQTPIRSNSSACLSRKSPYDTTARSHNGHSERSTPSAEPDVAVAATERRKPHKRKAVEQNCEIPQKKPFSADDDDSRERVGSKSVINGLVKAPHLDSVVTASHKHELSSSHDNGLVTPAKKHSGKQLLRTPSASSVHSDTLDSMSTSSSLKTPARTPRVKTTAQLLEEMASKGSLNIAGSEAVRKIALNQIDKEHDTDSSVVPAGAKPRPRKKARTFVPPSAMETKHDMVHKFLATSVPVPPTPDIDLNDSATSPFASTRLHCEYPNSGAEAKNNHNSSFIGNGSFHAVDKKRSHTCDSPNDIGDGARSLLGDLGNETRRVSPVRIKLSMRRDKQQQNSDSAIAESRPCIISNNGTSTQQQTCHMKDAIGSHDDPWSLLQEVDTDSLDWTSLDYDPPEPLAVTPSVIDRLHTQQWTGVNGQRDTWGDWRSWTQTHSAASYNGDLLHILPYVVLDEEEEQLKEEDSLLASLGETSAESLVEEGGVTSENRMDGT